MDLQNEWNNMNEEVVFNSEKELAAAGHFVKKESFQLLTTLEKNLKMKLLWVRLIDIPVLAAAFFLQGSIRYALLIVVLVYELGRYFMIRSMKTLNYELDYSQTTAEVIRMQLEVIKKSLKVERIWGYLFIPLAGPFGFIFSQLAHGKTFSALLAEPRTMYILPLLMLLVVPGIWLTKKMNQIAFGKYINKLNAHLQQMNPD